MTKWIHYLLLLLLAGAQSECVMGKDHFVFAYYSNNIYAPLPQSASCVETLAEIFKNNTNSKTHPLIDNQPKEVFLTRLRRIASRVSTDDTLYFFYSGHGKTFDGADCIVTNQSAPDDVITVQSIIDIFKTSESPPSSSLFVFDACRSSLRGSGPAARQLQLPDHSMVLMSTIPGKSSRTTKDGSYFMQSMISLLESAIVSEKRSLSVLDFVNSVRTKTMRDSERRQVPSTQSTVVPDDLEFVFLKKLDTRFTNSLNMEFVYLEEIDVHVSKHETTRGEFDCVMGNPGKTESSLEDPNLDRHPQTRVSWFDAMQFCLALTEREHNARTLPKHYYYRLPFDVEWSSAAGMTKEEGHSPNEREVSGKPTYAWGDMFPPNSEKAPGNYADETGMKGSVFEPIIGYDDRWQTTAPVGSYDANRLGLYDLSGNVWEWCYDFSDPFRTVDLKVTRGGSWFVGRSDALDLRCRYEASPNKKTSDIGFRCVIARREK